MKKIIYKAGLHSLATAVYISLIGSLMYFIEQHAPDSKSIVGPIAFLMLLVLSVAIVGTLLFGRPAMWYVDGKKKDAGVLLVYTLALFFLLTAIVFALFAIVW